MDAPAWAFTTKLAVAVVPEKVRRGVHSRVTLYRAKAAVASARARSRDSAVHLAVFLFMGIILLRMGASAGPSTLVTNEHMIFIQDFEKLLKSAGPPGDRQARAVGTTERWGGPDRNTVRPASLLYLRPHGVQHTQALRDAETHPIEFLRHDA